MLQDKTWRRSQTDPVEGLTESDQCLVAVIGCLQPIGAFPCQLTAAVLELTAPLKTGVLRLADIRTAGYQRLSYTQHHTCAQDRQITTSTKESKEMTEQEEEGNADCSTGGGGGG